ncbi:MAG: NnrU family protein [Alphaproteobacteria bacterium]|nr:NnrU family protein [Alphaproteobacteria bacterium]
MVMLVAGLALFIAAHAVPLSPSLRAALTERLGDGPVKGLVALVALAGVAAMSWGYGEARFEGSPAIWDPPLWTRHLAGLLVLVAFVLVAAAYTPNGIIKPTLKHPMLAGVKLWAVAHLLANGTVADVVLFGGLLGWAAGARIALARRERSLGAPQPARGPVANDLIALAVGAALWAVFVFWAHEQLFGVSPLGA